MRGVDWSAAGWSVVVLLVTVLALASAVVVVEGVW
jgi:hypothetical protein